MCGHLMDCLNFLIEGGTGFLIPPVRIKNLILVVTLVRIYLY